MSAKEIRTKISSIKNTQKITRAMEMVAASKMRKAQDRMEKSKPYAKRILQVIGHLAKGHAEYKHSYMQVRDPKRVGFIVVTTDRGLCGGLNVNLFKDAIAEIKKWQDRKVEIDMCLIGAKAESFFKRMGGNVVAQATHMGDKPSVQDVIGVVKTMLDAYEKGTIDALYLIYNDFVNTMSQQPYIEQLLPLVAGEEEELEYYWDYLYEPDSKQLLDGLLTRYIESQVYQAVVENNACEQAARMVAMKSATDNAGDLISELQLIYNKARQAAITTELSEIVAGAEAV